MPFDFPADWPEGGAHGLRAFHAARQAMQKQMDVSIAAHADQEILYDQPRCPKTKLRITGPFTVEAVPFPTVLGLDGRRAAGTRPMSASRARANPRASTLARRTAEDRHSRQGRADAEVRRTGNPAGYQLPARDRALADTGERVVVSFGPEHAALEQRQVEMAMREAGELFPRPKMIVFCAFTFDPEAAKDIDQTKGITALKAQMNTDLLTEDLKKARSSNQSFWLMGQPDVEVRKQKDGTYRVEVHGFDYFDTAKGEILSGGNGKIAMWLLDTDYDERSLFPRQVFFPMAGAKDGWNNLARTSAPSWTERSALPRHRIAALRGGREPADRGEDRGRPRHRVPQVIRLD